MENKNLTAVEWLEEMLKEYKYLNKNADHYFEQAKQMEKDKIEISDEEIEKIAKEHVLYNESKRNWVVEGMKLYREQLKRKQ